MKELAEQRLTIIEKCDYTTKSGKKMPGYLCKCECGNIKVVSKNSYDSGKTKSCGCLIRDFNAKRGQYYEGSCYSEAKKYGVEESVIKKIVSSYKSMMTRCRNPHHIKYKNYGGRGISVCEEWVNSKSAFIQWALENGFEEGKSIDRIDVNGNYEPANCRWATPEEQANNTRRNVYIKFNGEFYTITKLAKVLNIDIKILSYLAKHGLELKKDMDAEMIAAAEEDERNAQQLEGQMEITDFPEVMP